MLTKIIKWVVDRLYNFTDLIKGISIWFTETSFVTKIFIFALIGGLIWLIKEFGKLGDEDKIDEERYIHNRKF